MTTRAVTESPLHQGEDEQIVYTLTTTPWGTTPTSVAVVVKDLTNANLAVTSTVMPTNSPTVNGDVITLSPLKLLTAGHTYRVEVKFTAGGNVYEAHCDVVAEG